MSRRDDMIRDVVSQPLCQGAIADALRALSGRAGAQHAVPGTSHIARHLTEFAEGAIGLALLDDGMPRTDTSVTGWRARLANENHSRLTMLFGADAFTERYVDELLDDGHADVNVVRSVTRGEYDRLFNVVTQAVRLKIYGIDPAVLPQPTVRMPHDH